MIDVIELLVVCCAVQAVVIALTSATVPALWWILCRTSIKADKDREELKELKKDLATLDEVVDRLCRTMNFNDSR